MDMPQFMADVEIDGLQAPRMHNWTKARGSEHRMSRAPGSLRWIPSVGKHKKAGLPKEAGLNRDCFRCLLWILDVRILAQIEPPVHHQAYRVEHRKAVHGHFRGAGLDFLAHHPGCDEGTVGGNR